MNCPQANENFDKVIDIEIFQSLIAAWLWKNYDLIKEYLNFQFYGPKRLFPWFWYFTMASLCLDNNKYCGY